jgi:hypothetical protein
VALSPHEAALHVGVAEEGDGAGDVAEGLGGFRGGDDVVVLVERRAVHEVETGDLDGTFRQRADVGGVVGGQLALGPQGGGARDGVEPLQVFHADAGAVVIAPHDLGDIGADPLRDGVGVGAVAHEIAAAQHPVVAPGGGLQHRFERLQIGVYVADDEVPQIRLASAVSGRPRAAPRCAPESLWYRFHA